MPYITKLYGQFYFLWNFHTAWCHYIIFVTTCKAVLSILHNAVYNWLSFHLLFISQRIWNMRICNFWDICLWIFLFLNTSNWFIPSARLSNGEKVMWPELLDVRNYIITELLLAGAPRSGVITKFSLGQFERAIKLTKDNGSSYWVASVCEYIYIFW